MKYLIVKHKIQHHENIKIFWGPEHRAWVCS